MSNRLEQEFPNLAWEPMPPIGSGGVSPEAMRECLERGRQLRNQALRSSLRAGRPAMARGVVLLMALIRSGTQAIARRRHARDCRAGSAHGA
jgi:hypothetical protein